MKCREAAERMIDLLDVEEHPGMKSLQEHLENCPECRVDFDRAKTALEMVRPEQRIVASQHFKERAMKAIIQEAERENQRGSRPWIWRGMPKWVAVGCAAAILLLIFPMLPMGTRGSQTAGLKLLAQSVEAMSNLKTVHILGRMRTVPGDNFELVGTKYDFVPVELWREYGGSLRWRVEKTGRVVVMDGQSSLLYISKTNKAVKGTPENGFVLWLRPLLSPENILQKEWDAARAGETKAKLVESDGALILSVQAKARGDFANNWMKNTSIEESDHTCIYRFDANSKRLEGLQVLIDDAGKQVSVLELTDFRYDETFPANVFALQLPPDVNWGVEPQNMKAAWPALSGPRDVAEFFFDALAREDWDAALEVYPVTRLDEKIKHVLGGLQIVFIGKPFRSGLYPGYFVPYEIRLRDGSTMKYKLAVRNDNPASRWIVDGGF